MDATLSHAAVTAEARASSHTRPVAIWLLACCALLLAMVVVGGVTRLTHSGLSIVQWQPIVGTVPPLDATEWEAAFARYQATPEFRLVNRDMTLEGFKGIFWWEYFHRLLGRGIGIVFVLPLAWFALRRRIDRPLARRLAFIFGLGLLQGAVGWWMVKSGLVDDPKVSPLRLATHLGIAVLIYAAMFWTALDLLVPTGRGIGPTAHRRLAAPAMGIAALVFLMILSGGLVAGTRAGFAYNTFPLMDGHWIPPGLLAVDPWHASLWRDLTTVQFNHRALAWLLALLIPVFCWRVHRSDAGSGARFAAHGLLAALLVQVTLGVATLLMRVPVPVAAAHQAGAMVLFTFALWTAHRLRA
jgi:cytochrome c oxidase assembly protein subunit 15